MNLETQLKDVFRRVDPPDGFADGVIRRLPGQARLPVLHKAIAAGALLAMLGGWGVHATLRARNDLVTAMRLASHKVANVHREIRK